MTLVLDLDDYGADDISVRHIGIRLMIMVLVTPGLDIDDYGAEYTRIRP